jgi:hypothetical protein
VVLAAATGCWVGGDGTRHRLVLGVGVVSTHASAGVGVDDVRLLGLYTGRDGVAAGLVGAHEVTIDPRVADVVVSVRATPWSLRVVTQSPPPAEEANRCEGGSRP